MRRQQCAMILVLTCIATAATAQTIENRLAECVGLNDPQQRLSCFDTLAGDVASGSGQVVSNRDQQATIPPASPIEDSVPSDRSAEDRFGLEHKDINEALADELRTKVTEIYKNAMGKMLLILDNGQIWRQKDSKTLIIHKGDSVRIERGVIGSFYLTANDKKRISVTRVR